MRISKKLKGKKKVRFESKYKEKYMRYLQWER